MPPSDERASTPSSARGLLAELCRRESAQVVASLVRLVGDLDVAEDLFQEAVVQALEAWPASGPPENPAAWLTTVAKNRGLNRIKREGLIKQREQALADQRAVEAAAPPDLDSLVIGDDRLRLIFTCCHPDLAPESQVALTLKLVCGLETDEIARALLVSEPTVAQRLVRAKRIIRDRKLPYVVPGTGELPARLSSVLSVIYLIFNAGYTATAGPSLMRPELIDEGLRVATLVVELMPREAEVHGLVALLELLSSRNETRVNSGGELVLLKDQDRAGWDQDLIRRALKRLEHAARLGLEGPYQLQAAIATCHAVAPTWEATDWRTIALCYERLKSVAPSPVVELNRAVAVSMTAGPEAGLAILDSIQDAPQLRDYHLFSAARADMLGRLQRWYLAAKEYRRALCLVQNEREREFLERRLKECEANLPKHV